MWNRFWDGAGGALAVAFVMLLVGAVSVTGVSVAVYALLEIF